MKQGSNGRMQLPLQNVLDASRGAFTTLLARIAESETEASGARVLVVGPSRGVGASTVAASLAASLASHFARGVLLVDADVYEPTQHSYFDAEQSPGLLNVAHHGVALEAAIRPTWVRRLSLLPAGGAGATGAGALADLAVADALERAGRQADALVIDAPPVLTHPDVFRLRGRCTHVVLVVGAGATRKRDARDAVRVLREAGLDPTGVIFNRYRPASLFGLRLPD